MKYKIGDKVIFVNQKKHEENPSYYPPVNTVGTIVFYSKETEGMVIQWPTSLTCGTDKWYCECDNDWILPYSSSQKRIVDIQPYLDILEHDIKELQRLGLSSSIRVMKAVIKDIEELPVLES